MNSVRDISAARLSHAVLPPPQPAATAWDFLYMVQLPSFDFHHLAQPGLAVGCREVTDLHDGTSSNSQLRASEGRKQVFMATES
jgi:hypothetical protein